MKSLIICLLGAIFLSCAKEQTLFGVYENEKGDEVTINCDYRISSDKLADQLFMPKSGDKITLNAHQMDPVEFELTYQMDNHMKSTFGSWNRNTGELKIGIATFVKKQELSCGDE